MNTNHFTTESILIIPDVHGRPFWKEAVASHPDLPIVFLGDYLDCYIREGIGRESTLTNFIEILDFKSDHPDQVTLLLGNHDLHYLVECSESCRKDTENEELIHHLFVKHLLDFKLAHLATIGETDYLFTHAGILAEWVQKRLPGVGVSDCSAIVAALNAATKSVADLQSFAYHGLLDVSYYRGGYESVGSCLWADMQEHDSAEAAFPSVYQIFGHTQQRELPVIDSVFANLDCRRAFILKADGSITDLAGIRYR